ncbi:hypothetical protein D3C80_1852990 [compost metagenome]
MSNKRGFEKYQLLQLYPLPHCGHIIHQRSSELFRLQPEPREGMTPSEHNHRVESDLLQGGTEQQGEIHTCSQASIGNLARAAHLLP